MIVGGPVCDVHVITGFEGAGWLRCISVGFVAFRLALLHFGWLHCPSVAFLSVGLLHCLLFCFIFLRFASLSSFLHCPSVCFIFLQFASLSFGLLHFPLFCLNFLQFASLSFGLLHFPSVCLTVFATKSAPHFLEGALTVVLLGNGIGRGLIVVYKSMNSMVNYELTVRTIFVEISD